MIVQQYLFMYHRKYQGKSILFLYLSSKFMSFIHVFMNEAAVSHLLENNFLSCFLTPLIIPLIYAIS